MRDRLSPHRFLPSLATAAAVLLAAASPAAAAGDFSEPASSPQPTAARALDIASGDFNEDGRRDLAAPNADTNNVTILLGNGSGGFTPASGSPESSGGSFPRSIVVGDFNEDGHQDLAVGNDFDDTVAILLGDGTGDFTLSSTGPEAGAAGFDSVVGDFDEDGNQDIASSNFFVDNVRLLLGNGAGDFAPAVDRAAGQTPTSLAIADFDEDGNQDLAVSNGQDQGKVSVLLGDGDGGFSPAPTSPEDAGDSPSDVVAADFDGDGDHDLAVSDRESNSATVLLGDGAGDFSEAPSSPEAANDLLNGLTSGDFNVDGDADLAVVGESGQVFVFLGDGSGDFSQPATSPEPLRNGSGARAILSDDFDENGLPDLAVASANSFGASGISILLNGDRADLRVVQSDSPDPVVQGALLSYVIEVRNDGPDAARGIRMRNLLPASVDFVSAEPTKGSCVRQGRVLVCEFRPLDSGDTARVRVRVRPRASGRIVNAARVLSDSIDPNASNDVAREETTVRAAGPTPPPPPPPGPCTITGTAGNDVLVGTPGRDVICARGGNDVVRGADGDDIIRGEGGNDNLRGGRGADRIDGGEGNDIVIGEAGDDRLFGGLGADMVTGLGGDDALDVRDGARGNDGANGGPGDDSCQADAGDRRTSC